MAYDPLAFLNQAMDPFGGMFNDPLGPMGGAGGGAYPSNLQFDPMTAATMPDGRYFADEMEERDITPAQRIGALLMDASMINTGRFGENPGMQMLARQMQLNEAHNRRARRAREPQLVKVGDSLVQATPKAGGGYSISTVYTDPEAEQAGAFEGTGMEAQMLNIYLDPTIPPNDPRKQLAVQKLTQPRVVTTPEGTYAVPGYNLQELQGMAQGGAAPAPGVAQSAPYGAPAVPGGTQPAAYGGIPGFTPKPPPAEKPPTESERRGEFSVGNMRNLDAQATDYIPDTISALANEWLPGAVKGYIQTPEYRSYNRLASEWAANWVFLRSGATARKDEVDAAVQNYWPQPGDDPDQVASKAAEREAAMAEAEQAYLDRIGGQPSGGTSATDGEVDYVFNPATGKLEPAR